MNKLRVCIYTRVSTLDQNTESQKIELIEYCKSRNWTVSKIIEEKKTGTNTNRPGFQELIRISRSRKIDIILVFKLDRAFRSLKDSVTYLNEWVSLGVEFVSLKDGGLDMTTPTGKLLIHLLSSFAEFEASLIRERVRSGLENAKRKGTKLGRPSYVSYEQIVQLRNNGMSMGAIAKQMGISKGTVSKTLKKIELKSTNKGNIVCN